MKKRILKIFVPALALAFLSGMLLPAWAAQEVALMTTAQLNEILAEPDTYVLDVRAGRDWNASEFKIQGAHRADPGAFDSWSAQFPKDGTLVLYCA